METEPKGLMATIGTPPFLPPKGTRVTARMVMVDGGPVVKERQVEVLESSAKEIRVRWVGMVGSTGSFHAIGTLRGMRPHQDWHLVRGSEREP